MLDHFYPLVPMFNIWAFSYVTGFVILHIHLSERTIRFERARTHQISDPEQLLKAARKDGEGATMYRIVAICTPLLYGMVYMFGDFFLRHRLGIENRFFVSLGITLPVLMIICYFFPDAIKNTFRTKKS